MAISTEAAMQQHNMQAHNVSMKEPSIRQQPAPEYLRGLFTGLLAGLGTLRGIYYIDEGVGSMYGGPPSVAVAITKRDGGKVLIEVDTPSGSHVDLEKLRAKFAIELS